MSEVATVAPLTSDSVMVALAMPVSSDAETFTVKGTESISTPSVPGDSTQHEG